MLPNCLIVDREEKEPRKGCAAKIEAVYLKFIREKEQNMSNREKFLQAIDFISEKSHREPGDDNMSVDELRVFLTVAQFREITVGHLSARLNMGVSAVLHTLSLLTAREDAGQPSSHGFITLEWANNLQDKKATITDKGWEFIRKLVFYVEKENIRSE